jgi:hypothetical protein
VAYSLDRGMHSCSARGGGKTRSALISETRLQPHSAMLSSNSSRSMLSASSTPRCPPSVSAHSTGRPRSTAEAPMAKHLMIWRGRGSGEEGGARRGREMCGAGDWVCGGHFDFHLGLAQRSKCAHHFQLANLHLAMHTTCSTPKHTKAQRSTAQHSTAQHSTAQHSTAQHRTCTHVSRRSLAARRRPPARARGHPQQKQPMAASAWPASGSGSGSGSGLNPSS